MSAQADATNVRAATRAATCHLKLGQLDEAEAVLDAVKATIAEGQLVPADLISKQNDLALTKRMVAEVTSLFLTCFSLESLHCQWRPGWTTGCAIWHRGYAKASLCCREHLKSAQASQSV